MNAHVINNMSYDLILGRDWCEANGVRIYFNYKKIFLIKPNVEKDYNVISEIGEILPTSDIQKYAHLTQSVNIKPYHETPILVKCKLALDQ